MATSDKIYKCLFHPRSIAVIGASNDEFKPGGRVTKNIKENGFNGQLWAVNPRDPNIMDVPTFKSAQELPHIPDLAIVAIPAKFVLSCLQELADLGVKAAVILTAGFGEKNEEGKIAEQQMVEIAEKAGMALVGPNCSGFLTPSYKGKFAGLIPPLSGNAVDFISGSGATVDYVMECASVRGLSFGTVLNLGNSIQLSVEDLLELYDEHYEKGSDKILMLYMETVRKPKKLLTHAASLNRKGCSVIGIKAGTTAAGQQAAASHTGALATSDTAVEALFKKAGIMRVNSRAELIDVACILSTVKALPLGKNICVVTDAGGPGVMLADELNRQGLQLATLSDQTLKLLAEILPAESSIVNPIDMLPSRSDEQIRDIIQVLVDHETGNIDGIVVLTGDSRMSDNGPIYHAIAEAMENSPIPVFAMLSSLTSCAEKIENFIARGKTYFPDEVALGAALGKVASWSIPADGRAELEGYDYGAIAAAINGQKGVLRPDIVERIIRGAGFKLPSQQEVQRQNDLRKMSSKVGYPQAMKVIGPLHKTDVGGVLLHIEDEHSAAGAWQKLMRIPGARGVLVQQMITGSEVILGASEEGEFGHLVMFGMGGIYAEVLKDVQFNLAPLSADECRSMIRSIRGHAIVDGVRGEEGMDEDVLADYTQRLGRLVSDFPQIGEIDLNPIKGVGTELYVVDARILVVDGDAHPNHLQRERPSGIID